MHRMTSLAGVGLALLGTLLSAPIAGAQAQPHSSATGPAPAPVPMWVVCRLGRSVGGRMQTRGTTYFSGIMRRANLSEADYSKAFAAFLEKKYGVVSGPPECGVEPSEAQAEKALEMWTGNDGLITYVHTGWTYTPATPAPSTPAPPGAASTPPH